MLPIEMSAALFTPAVLYASIFFVTAWAIVSCVRAFAAEVAYREAHHKLLIRVQILRLEHVPRFRQVQKNCRGSSKNAKQGDPVSEAPAAQRMAA